MRKLQTLELSFHARRDPEQFAIVSRRLEVSLDRHLGVIERHYHGLGRDAFVLGFPDAKSLNAYFAHENWLDLQADLEAAGIGWRRAGLVYAAAA